MKRIYRIEITRTSPAGAWYWRVMAKNGQVMLTSETYSTRSNATRAARRWANGVTMMPKGWTTNYRLWS